LPVLRRIVYKLIPNQNTLLTQLQTGEIDLWATVNGTLTSVAKALQGKRSTTWLSNFMSAIYFNTSHPAIADPRVRRATAGSERRSQRKCSVSWTTIVR
ncbi:MAG: ABC transporter substrate-binding protein, partial [Vulcanimicrobiaceae bacterium]